MVREMGKGSLGVTDGLLGKVKGALIEGLRMSKYL